MKKGILVCFVVFSLFGYAQALAESGSVNPGGPLIPAPADNARPHSHWCENRISPHVCNDLAEPSRCTAKSVDGFALHPAITESGANPCFAEYAVELAACERGIDPESFRPSDITCSPTPLPMIPVPVSPPVACPDFCTTAGCAPCPSTTVNPGGPIILAN